nr:hypothetical protein [Tanacetum cinerariifolium]
VARRVAPRRGGRHSAQFRGYGAAARGAVCHRYRAGPARPQGLTPARRAAGRPARRARRRGKNDLGTY